MQSVTVTAFSPKIQIQIQSQIQIQILRYSEDVKFAVRGNDNDQEIKDYLISKSVY